MSVGESGSVRVKFVLLPLKFQYTNIQDRRLLLCQSLRGPLKLKI